MIKSFLVFGDSIAYGALDAQGGWVARLRAYIDSLTLDDPNSYFRLFNLSIGGDSIEGLLKRFEYEAEQRLSEEANTTIIFAIGINDAHVFVD